MKKISAILSALLLSMFLFCPVMAAEHPDRMIDEADLLMSDEEANVRHELNVLSEKLQFDIAIVTVDSTEGSSIQDFADDYYDYNGYGMGNDYDGAMLVINMQDREWYITTSGYGIVAMPYDELGYIADEFLPYLSEGDYEMAFLVFAGMCESYVTDASMAGVVYDEEEINSQIEEEPSPFLNVTKILGCLVGGFVLAFLPMSIMKREMKTVGFKAEARDYVVQGSRTLTVSRDRFLYHTINRTAKPKDTSRSSGGGGVHRSSSGRSHGGRGGSF